MAGLKPVLRPVVLTRQGVVGSHKDAGQTGGERRNNLNTLKTGKTRAQTQG